MTRFTRTVASGGMLLLLAACGYADPYAKDWDRNRVTQVPINTPDVTICFDRSYHAQAEIEALAVAQCQDKVKEIETLRLSQNAQAARFQNQAEGTLFDGPVARARIVEAILKTVSVDYVSNDRFSCSLVMPNSVTYSCLYNPSARPAVKKIQQTPIPADLTAPAPVPADLQP